MNISSEFKGLQGVDIKEKFTNCCLGNPNLSNRLIAVNKKYLAMIWDDYRKIIVIDSSSKSTKLDQQFPSLYSQYNALDLEFSPFNDNLLASSTYSSVLLWRIPQNGLTNDLIIKEEGEYKNHVNKVFYINHNPVVSDLICSGSFAGEIHVWNQKTLQSYNEIQLKQNPTNVYWNPNGSLIGVSTKEKLMNIIDPRNKGICSQKQLTKNYNPPKFVWADNDLFLTTDSFGRNTSLKLWDIRNNISEVENLSIEYCSNNTLLSDLESKLLYIVEKEKKDIHVYSYTQSKLKKMTSFLSEEKALCSVLFDRKSLDFKNYEIDRLARYNSNKTIYYVSFKMNRRYKYPSKTNREKVLTYDEWANKREEDKNQSGQKKEWGIYQKRNINDTFNNVNTSYISDKSDNNDNSKKYELNKSYSMKNVTELEKNNNVLLNKNKEKENENNELIEKHKNTEIENNKLKTQYNNESKNKRYIR